jgi:hypothetical protein
MLRKAKHAPPAGGEGKKEKKKKKRFVKGGVWVGGRVG